MNKVYCEECKWYTVGMCDHINNLGDYFDRMRHKTLPSEINKYNNCNWFEKNKKGEK